MVGSRAFGSSLSSRLARSTFASDTSAGASIAPASAGTEEHPAADLDPPGQIHMARQGAEVAQLDIVADHFLYAMVRTVVGTALVDALRDSLDADGKATAKTVPAVADLVAALARDICPELPVAITSGYIDENLASQASVQIGRAHV